MNTGNYDAAVPLDRPTAPNAPAHNLRRWWGAITGFLVAAIFAQAIFGGAMLSGIGWAHAAHATNAGLLIASTTIAGLVGIVFLRGVAHGLRLGLTLLALAAAVALQTAVGGLSAHGANLMWAHVPLGVALVGFAALAVADARRLGGA